MRRQTRWNGRNFSTKILRLSRTTPPRFPSPLDAKLDRTFKESWIPRFVLSLFPCKLYVRGIANLANVRSGLRGRKEDVEGVLFRNEASREIFGWDNGELVNPADLSRLDFQRDVRILAALEDRNIARVLGACYREEPYCVVMEYLEHGDLCQFLKTHITAEDAHSMPIGVKTLR